MQNVATLMGSIDHPVSEQNLNQLISLAGKHDSSVIRHSWLCEREAVDVFFDGDLDAFKKDGAEFAADVELDLIIQPIEGRRKKALLADMESTLIKQEMLEELADYVGLRAEVEDITTRAMNGELDFKAALKERLALLRDMPGSIVNDLNKKITVTPGARELAATMRKHGARCIIVSGGFKVFTDYVANMLGFDANHGNILDIKDGKITGEMVEPVLDKNSKRSILADTAKTLQISESAICAVGDGANDLPMLLAAGLGIAYHAKPSVQKQANYNIRYADLRGLLWAQGYHAKDLA